MTETFIPRGRGLQPVIVVTALILALCAACGSSSKGSNSAAGATSTTGAGSPSTAATSTGGGASGCPSAPGVTPTEVKVGVLWDQTGANAAGGGPFGAGVHARFDVANDSGGVNGRKIVESDADTQSSPGNGLAAVQGLVKSNGVNSVIIGTQIVPTVFPYAIATKLPLFDPLSGAPSFATEPNLISAAGAWYTPTGGSLNSPLFLQFLQQNQVKTLAIFAHSTPASTALAHTLSAAAAKAGIKVVYENDAIPFQAFDATSIGLRLKQLKPEAAYFAIALAPAISIIHSAQQQGSLPKYPVLTTGYDPTTLKAGISGAYTLSGYTPFIGPLNDLSKPAQDFRNAMAKYQPTAPTGFASAEGWVTGDLFLHALQLAGQCPTQANIVSQIRTVTGYNPGAISPSPVRFAPGLTPNGNPQNCTYVVQINGTSFSIPTTPVCVNVSS